MLFLLLHNNVWAANISSTLMSHEIYINYVKRESGVVCSQQLTLHATLWGQSLPNPRGGEIFLSNVTTSRCLILPLQIHGVWLLVVIATSTNQPQLTFYLDSWNQSISHCEERSSVTMVTRDINNTYLASGSYSAHNLTNSSKWWGPRIDQSRVR